jgi:Na+/melibiose symporter-like transporter
LLALPLAALGLPFYLYVPTWLVEQRGFGFGEVAWLFLLARFIDVCTDLPVGVWVDRAARRDRVMRLGVLVLLLAVVLLFFASSPLVAAAAIALLFFAWTLLTVPWLAAPTTRAPAEQLSWNAGREALLLVGTILGLVLPAAFGFAWWLLLLMLLLLVLAVWLQPSVSAAGSANSVKQDLVLLWRDKAGLRLWGVWLLNSTANAVPGVVLLVFCRDVLGAEQWLPALLIAYFMSAIVAVVLYKCFAPEFGLVRLWHTAVLVSILAFAPVALLGEGDVFWFLLCCVVTGFCAGIDSVAPVTLQTRWVSQRLQAGAQNVGASFGFWGMAQKLALGLAVVLAFALFGALGPQPTVAQEAASALPSSLVTAVYVWVPVALKSVIALLMFSPRVVRPLMALSSFSALGVKEH